AITIHDINGSQISEIVSGNLPMGIYTVMWHANDYPSGIYFAKLNMDQTSQTIKLTLIR
ncbi:MAG: T9SS type A sorting domain-containing protein, partial [Calditrichaeota bacterium]|nr:T9SS type A sorting domain-containing protein [Calditrichota bacterium]